MNPFTHFTSAICNSFCAFGVNTFKPVALIVLVRRCRKEETCCFQQCHFFTMFRQKMPQRIENLRDFIETYILYEKNVYDLKSQ